MPPRWKEPGVGRHYRIIDDRLVNILHLAKHILLAYHTQSTDLLADAAENQAVATP